MCCSCTLAVSIRFEALAVIVPYTFCWQCVCNGWPVSDLLSRLNVRSLGLPIERIYTYYAIPSEQFRRLSAYRDLSRYFVYFIRLAFVLTCARVDREGGLKKITGWPCPGRKTRPIIITSHPTNDYETHPLLRAPVGKVHLTMYVSLWVVESATEWCRFGTRR